MKPKLKIQDQTDPNAFWTRVLFKQDRLGCGYPVSSANFWVYLRKFCVKADIGRLAGQRREFKTHRKSTAQLMCVYLSPTTNTNGTRHKRHRERWCRERESLARSLWRCHPQCPSVGGRRRWFSMQTIYRAHTQLCRPSSSPSSSERGEQAMGDAAVNGVEVFPSLCPMGMGGRLSM